MFFLPKIGAVDEQNTGEDPARTCSDPSKGMVSEEICPLEVVLQHILFTASQHPWFSPNFWNRKLHRSVGASVA